MPSGFLLAVGPGLPGSWSAARSRQFLTRFTFWSLVTLTRLPAFFWSSKLYFFFRFSTSLKACRALGCRNPYFYSNLQVIDGYFLPANIFSNKFISESQKTHDCLRCLTFVCQPYLTWWNDAITNYIWSWKQYGSGMGGSYLKSVHMNVQSIWNLAPNSTECCELFEKTLKVNPSNLNLLKLI